MKTLLILAVLSLSGCAVYTPYGQVPIQTNSVTHKVMSGPNKAWNCYVSPARCLQ